MAPEALGVSTEKFRQKQVHNRVFKESYSGLAWASLKGKNAKRIKQIKQGMLYHNKEAGVGWGSFHGGLDNLNLMLVDETQGQNSSRHENNACKIMAQVID